jgi:hypothetical protein
MKSIKLMKPRGMLVVVGSPYPDDSFQILFTAVPNEGRNARGEIGEVLAHGWAFGPILRLNIHDEQRSSRCIEGRTIR